MKVSEMSAQTCPCHIMESQSYITLIPKIAQK